MSAFPYPCELVFGQLEPLERRQRFAVVRASDALQLPAVSSGDTIRVTIASPSDAYRLGQQVMAILQPCDQPPPLPSAPSP